MEFFYSAGTDSEFLNFLVEIYIFLERGQLFVKENQTLETCKKAKAFLKKHLAAYLFLALLK